MALSASLALAGCGDERAVVVDVLVREPGDRLCLSVVDGEDVVFARGYEGDAGAPASGSLTLVAGDRVDERVRVSAFVSRGGRIVARGRGESGFGTLDTVHLPVEVARCTAEPGDAPARLRTVATLEVRSGARLAAVDLDADGRDELVALDGERLVAVNVGPSGGEPRTLELPWPEGAEPASAASLDADCLPDLVAISPAGAVVLRSPGARGETLPPLGPPARSVAAGRFSAEGSWLAVAGDGGLALVPLPDGSARSLADGAFGSVVAADLTGDGFDDLIASGPDGARAWLGSGGGAAENAGVLPASFAAVTGPLAAGDVDADGAIDVVGAAGGAVRVARNRRDGLLEDRSGPSAPAATSEIVRLLLADLDGDCRDDLATMDADGAVAVWRAEEGPSFAPEAITVGAASDITAADTDGDGRWEIAVLTRSGSLEVWGR